jgi:hypothetical protein
MTAMREAAITNWGSDSGTQEWKAKCFVKRIQTLLLGLCDQLEEGDKAGSPSLGRSARTKSTRKRRAEHDLLRNGSGENKQAAHRRVMALHFTPLYGKSKLQTSLKVAKKLNTSKINFEECSPGVSKRCEHSSKCETKWKLHLPWSHEDEPLD